MPECITVMSFMRRQCESGPCVTARDAIRSETLHLYLKNTRTHVGAYSRARSSCKLTASNTKLKKHKTN